MLAIALTVMCLWYSTYITLSLGVILIYQLGFRKIKISTILELILNFYSATLNSTMHISKIWSIYFLEIIVTGSVAIDLYLPLD